MKVFIFWKEVCLQYVGRRLFLIFKNLLKRFSKSNIFLVTNAFIFFRLFLSCLDLLFLFWNLTQFLTTWHVNHLHSECRRHFTIFQLVTENGSLCFIRLSSAELPAALTRVLFGRFIAQRPCQSSSKILRPTSSSKFSEILLEIGRR